MGFCVSTGAMKSHGMTFVPVKRCGNINNWGFTTHLSISVESLFSLTLMNQLVKGMLAISTRLPPHNRSSRVVHTSTLARYWFPIGFHITLSNRSTIKLNSDTKNIYIFTPQVERKEMNVEKSHKSAHVCPINALAFFSKCERTSWSLTPQLDTVIISIFS